MKSGWWVLLWMGGLALPSWIGHEGDGSLDLLTFGWGELDSLVPTFIAVTGRLSSQGIVDTVHRTIVRIPVKATKRCRPAEPGGFPATGPLEKRSAGKGGAGETHALAEQRETLRT